MFCVACRSGESYARPALIHGIEFLLDKYRLKSGGYASRTTISGDIIPGPIDLYDLSFCLFALAHSYEILRDSRLKDEAISLVKFIAVQFKHPSGGYAESIPATQPRRQNPHMHLLEALLEWRRLSDEVIFSNISDEMTSLFFDKFYQSEVGALLEYFDDELNPALDMRAGITEPGHHYEWVWLLKRYQDIANCNVQAYDKLYNFARQYGVNTRSGLLWGEVTSVGAPRGLRVRIWPHTEWVKAELARGESRDLSERVTQAWNALSGFLNCPQPGLWYETYDHERENYLVEPSPASSFYHIVLAIESLNEYVKTQSLAQ